jgi:hypothetical protein
MALCYTVALPSPAMAQSPELTPAVRSPVHTPPAATLPATTVWKFGMKVTATSDTSGIQATVPVPLNWDEQVVEVISIDKPEFVSDARIKKNGDESSHLYFKIGRLAAGEEATVTVTMQIAKLDSVAPDNTDRFRFESSPRGSLRKFLTPSPFIESQDRTIVELANSISLDENAPAWKQVETIYDWVRDNVAYQFDPEIRSCLTALENRRGDCEELSSLFIALCRARGIPARAVWIPEHTYPEFYLLDENGEGRWFPCQAAGSRAFGHMPEAKPILQKGDKFRVPGQREEVRYNQPTLKASNAASNPLVVWIMEPVIE